MWQVSAWLMIAVGALVAGPAVGTLVAGRKVSPAVHDARTTQWLLVFVGVTGMSIGLVDVAHAEWSQIVASAVTGMAILAWAASGIRARRQRSR
jgi:hypothetical protein